MSQIPWYQRSPESIGLEEANEILQDLENRDIFPNQFESLLTSVKEQIEIIKEKSKDNNPLAWFQPSYEQHLKLNAWIYGIDYLVDFDANRIGKTAGGVINALMWIIPNQEDWVMFKTYEDHKGRSYKAIPRPPMSSLKGIRKLLELHGLKGDPTKGLDDPNNLECYKLVQQFLHINRTKFKPNPSRRTIWVGGPDNDWNEKNIMKEWQKWTPKDCIEKFSIYENLLVIKFPNINNRIHSHTIIDVIFKSYDSEDSKWSGGAVDGIMMSEGIPQKIFNEIRQRFKYPAFGSWDYTPTEPRNTASKSAIAHKVFKGEEILPLHPFIYSGFGIEDCPDYIMPEDKRNDLIKAWANKPEGEARIKGKFYSSSPVVLSNYNKDIHALHITFKQLKALYTPRPLILFRGLDPGWGHVTSCSWMALAPDNTRYIYRIYAEAQRTISQRCLDIITLSGNKRIKHPKSPNMFQELLGPEGEGELIRMTWIDYHTFKTDETTGQAFALNYIQNGLIVRPSVTMGPKERATTLDDLLLPQSHLPHPITKKPPGSRVFFLVDEPGVAPALQKMTNIFWQTFEKGEKRGLTKDAIQDYDDDELDSVCYVTVPKFQYSSFITEQKESDGQKNQTRLSYSDAKFTQVFSESKIS